MKILNEMNGRLCSCGKTHSYATDVYVGKGVTEDIPQYPEKFSPQEGLCSV